MQNEVFTRREFTILKRMPNSIFPDKKVETFKSLRGILFEDDDQNNEI